MMIQFSLKCEADHRFDSWFKSATAFDTLHAAGMVSCPVCGSTRVDKALMAPRVQSGGTGPEEARETDCTPVAEALAKLRRKIEDTADYVGVDFAREARDMHDGLTPERSIYGEAKPEDARRLIEDGVPVAPLPFLPRRKAN
ncbi:DUF1178 family protein [Roseovarius sp. A-2]|uniref:DUF1178 family protein n=1 Tax=Roseovarius sp. A-2 TaxID=1570360 RepID=UPI0027D7FBC4|nr:DUF1178 family protein [Roseovarius sp. A-2]